MEIISVKTRFDRVADTHHYRDAEWLTANRYWKCINDVFDNGYDMYLPVITQNVLTGKSKVKNWVRREVSVAVMGNHNTIVAVYKRDGKLAAELITSGRQAVDNSVIALYSHRNNARLVELINNGDVPAPNKMTIAAVLELVQPLPALEPPAESLPKFVDATTQATLKAIVKNLKSIYGMFGFDECIDIDFEDLHDIQMCPELQIASAIQDLEKLSMNSCIVQEKSQEWDYMWAELFKSYEPRIEGYETWQYMGTWEVDGTWQHQFRHRSYQGKRVYTNIQPSESFTPSVIEHV